MDMAQYDSYKSSGIEWIGDIPSHWEFRKFNHICRIITDFVASGSFADLRENVQYLSEPDYAMLVRTTDLANPDINEGRVYISKESYTFLSNSNLFGGEVILPNVGSVGSVYMVPQNLYERMSLAPNSIMFKTKCSDRFYFYYFLSFPGNKTLVDLAQSTTLAKFNKTDLRAIRVLFPSPSEQKSIAVYLDTECKKIDDLIAKEEKRIKLIEETKLSIISKVITKGLSSEVSMKDSGVPWVGEVPSTWDRHRIKYDVTRSAAGVWGDEEKGNEDDIVCYRIADYDYSKGVLDNDNPTVRNIPAKDRQGRLLKKGDLLIEKSGGGDIWPVGRVVRYNYDLEAVSSNFIHSVTVDEQKIDPDFLYYYFRFLYANKVNLLYFNQTTGIQNLKVSAYLSQSLFAPELTEQKEIVDYLNKECSSYDTSIEKAKKQINLLKEYKQSLITEVVTGKRKVC